MGSYFTCLRLCEKPFFSAAESPVVAFSCRGGSPPLAETASERAESRRKRLEAVAWMERRRAADREELRARAREQKAQKAPTSPAAPPTTTTTAATTTLSEATDRLPRRASDLDATFNVLETGQIDHSGLRQRGGQSPTGTPTMAKVKKGLRASVSEYYSSLSFGVSVRR